MRALPGGKARIALLAALSLLIAVSGGIWYYRGYTRTPGYSLRMISEAVAAHDAEKFKRYVDIDRIVDSASDVIIGRITDAGESVILPSGGNFAEFAKMFKPPLAAGLRKAADGFVKTGEWGRTAESGAEAVDTGRLLEKTGLGGLEFGSAELTDPSEGAATAALRVRQPESGLDFLLRVGMEPDEGGVWRATGIENLGEFLDAVGAARRDALRKYLAETDAIMEKAGERTGAAERAMTAMAKGSGLGDMTTRRKMRDIVTSEILPAWTDTGESLDDVKAPPEARPLHRLRQRIAKMRADYFKDYAEWLETKDAGAVRKSNEILKEVRTLEREAEVLTRQLRQKGLGNQ